MIICETGIESGRIVHVIGPEHRFKISRLLIDKFLHEYQARVQVYLRRDFSSDDSPPTFRPLMVKLIVQATRHLFFFKLSPQLTDQKLEPIIERLD